VVSSTKRWISAPPTGYHAWSVRASWRPCTTSCDLARVRVGTSGKGGSKPIAGFGSWVCRARVAACRVAAMSYPHQWKGPGARACPSCTPIYRRSGGGQVVYYDRVMRGLGGRTGIAQGLSEPKAAGSWSLQRPDTFGWACRDLQSPRRKAEIFCRVGEENLRGTGLGPLACHREEAPASS